jgi:hypothetical protein
VIRWPAVGITALGCAVYVTAMVYALLNLLYAEWSSYGAVVTAGTVVLAVAGLVALVRSASRSASGRV